LGLFLFLISRIEGMYILEVKYLYIKLKDLVFNTL